jgi:protein-tyrosine phosphatase
MMEKEEENTSTIEEILPHIYISDIVVATKELETLKTLGISHIASFVHEIPSQEDLDHWKEANITQKTFLLNDWVDQRFLSTLEEFFDYVENILIGNKDAIFLVHCYMGISRSASAIMYYLMKKDKLLTPFKALEMVKKKRSFVEPNIWFMQQLNIWYYTHHFEELLGTNEEEEE